MAENNGGKPAHEAENGCDGIMNAPLTGELRQDIRLLKVRAKVQRDLINAKQTSQEVAGKLIGRQALFYITLIIVVGVGASLYLEEEKLAAVIGLVSAALTALISMANGIVNRDKVPEKETIPDLPEEPEPPVTVNVSKGKVDVQTKDSRVITDKEENESA